MRRFRGAAGPAMARIAAGGVCLLGVRAREVVPVVARVRSAHSPRPPGSADRLALVLAVRYVAQAWAIESGHGGGVRLRAGIEAIHAFTMALAAVTMPRHRTEALAALVVAAAVALADVGQTGAGGRRVRRWSGGACARARFE